jgi:hypothetical protein
MPGVVDPDRYVVASEAPSGMQAGRRQAAPPYSLGTVNSGILTAISFRRFFTRCRFGTGRFDQ